MTSEPRSPANLPRHELIGLVVEVTGSPDPTQKGVRGTVVDETMRTLVVRSGDRDRTIPKTGRTFVFEVDGDRVEVAGSAIAYRPEDRPKKVRSS